MYVSGLGSNWSNFDLLAESLSFEKPWGSEVSLTLITFALVGAGFSSKEPRLM